MREMKRMRREIAGAAAAVLLGLSAPLGAAEPPKGLDPEAVAFAFAVLADPGAGAINGQTLVLDGGGIQS